MKKIEYDILGRVIYELEPITGTFYEYEYHTNDFRTITIINENNKSNFKTVKKQLLVDGEYIDKECVEIGEKYKILRLYDYKNREVYYERTNLKTEKVFKQTYFWKNNQMNIWLIEYDDGKKEIGFIVSPNIISEIIKKN